MIDPEFMDAEIGGDKFFALIQSMPDPLEALSLIDLARLHFMEIMANENSTSNDRRSAHYVLHKLKIERRKINQCISRTETREAVKAIFGEEGWAQVREWVIIKRNKQME